MSKIRIKTPKFIVSYPNVFKPKLNTLNDNMEFSMDMVWPKGTDLTSIKKAMSQVVKEKWPSGKPAGLKNPLKSGSVEADKAEMEGKDKEFLRDCTFAKAKTGEKFPPVVVDEKREQFLNQKDFYAGCIAHAYINITTYDKKGNKGVSFYLDTIQKLEDGERMGGVVSNIEEDFEILDDGFDNAADDEGDHVDF